MPSSRATVATVATARPVLITSFTASSLYSGVNSRRCLPMTNILTYKVSTVRGEGQGYALHPRSVRPKARDVSTSSRISPRHRESMRTALTGMASC